MSWPPRPRRADQYFTGYRSIPRLSNTRDGDLYLLLIPLELDTADQGRQGRLAHRSIVPPRDWLGAVFVRVAGVASRGVVIGGLGVMPWPADCSLFWRLISSPASARLSKSSRRLFKYSTRC